MSNLATTPPIAVCGSASRIALLRAAILLLSYILFFYALGQRDLWNSHEPRAAMDAQTILDDGAWGLPRLYDGRPEMQKPPLYYWLVALAAWCRGGVVDAWAVRLPAALAALGGVVAVHELGRRRGRPLAGLFAALVLATAMHYTWLARVGRIDMPLTLTVTLTLAGYYLRSGADAEQRERVCSISPLAPASGERGGGEGVTAAVAPPHPLPLSPEDGGEGRLDEYGALVLMYLSIGLGLLLKGPIAIVLPAAVIGVHRLVERKSMAPWRMARRFGLWWGVPLIVLVAGPWYIWAHLHTEGEFFRVFLWHHNLERGMGGSEVLRAHPWWFYGPQFLFDFLPWSPCLLIAAGWGKRGGWRDDPLARFGLVWLATMLVVLSCFRFKRADYLLPAYPGAALFLGVVAERCYRLAPRRVLLTWGGAAGLAVIAWLVQLEWILPQREPSREYRRFAEEIRRHAPAPEAVLFFRTEAHALAFHVGRPMEVRVGWHDLDSWATQPGARYVIMPRHVAEQRGRHLKSCALDEVIDNCALAGGVHEKPLVLLRSRPLTAE